MPNKLPILKKIYRSLPPWAAVPCRIFIFTVRNRILRPIKLVKFRSVVVAQQDNALKFSGIRPFSTGNRPVIRWVKSDGLDDAVTRSAIAQATRLFGNEVDYCICTVGLDAARVRSILSWADQPVEWWPVTPLDNPALAGHLEKAGCSYEDYGYWWKWFPERVRPDGPEWILDGDMVIIGKPTWFEQWKWGNDVLRVSQDRRSAEARSVTHFGDFDDLIDPTLMLYSGLISLPPRLRYMEILGGLLERRPLESGHNGRRDMSEQGAIAYTFQQLGAQPIPLEEFPFSPANDDSEDFEVPQHDNTAWGYHFFHSFVRKNRSFLPMLEAGIVFSIEKTDPVQRNRWLADHGQWGIPGSSLNAEACRIICATIEHLKGKPVLEIGTSRGHLTGMMAEAGCKLTTIDHVDRGAKQNLHGLNVNVVIADAAEFLESTDQQFDAIVCDLHGNTPDDWKRISASLLSALRSHGLLITNNAELYKFSEWSGETGVKWFIEQLSSAWKVNILPHPAPGLAIIQKP